MTPANRVSILNAWDAAMRGDAQSHECPAWAVHLAATPERITDAEAERRAKLEPRTKAPFTLELCAHLANLPKAEADAAFHELLLPPAA